MKVCIKSFFLSVLMSLVTLVSCVQEANDGSQRLDGTVADLSGQVASVSSSLEQLNALQNVVEQDLSELSADLETHIVYLKSGVSRMDGTMATLQLQKEVAMVVAELQAAGFESSMTQFVKSVKSWLGKSFETYFDVLVYGCASQALVEGAALQLSEQHGYIDAVLSDVEAGLRDGVPAEELASVLETLAKNLASATELTSKVDEIVLDLETECVMAVEALFDESSSYDASALKKASTQARIQLKSADVTISDLVDRIEDIEAAVAEIRENISGLRTDVNELLGMIQSLTFVSEYSDDKAVAYYSMTDQVDSERTSEGKKERVPQETFNLTFLVRPAAVADALAETWQNSLSVIGYYANRIQQQATANIQSFEITNAVSTTGKGLLTVTVNNAFDDEFYFKEKGAMLALAVESGKNNCASKFVEIVPRDITGKVYAESLELTPTTLSIQDGDTYRLTAKVTPSNVTDQGVVWANEYGSDYFDIDQNGIVTAKKASGGEASPAKVTAKATDEWGRPLEAWCMITVTPAIRVLGPDAVVVGESSTLKVQSPNFIDPKNITWELEAGTNAGFLSLAPNEDGTCTISGLMRNYDLVSKQYKQFNVKCTITGFANDVEIMHPICVIEVQPKEIAIEGLASDEDKMTVKLDDKFQLVGSIKPDNVNLDYFKLNYSTDHPGVVSYDNNTGVYTAVRIGGATLNAKVTDKTSASYFYPKRNEFNKSIYVTVEPYWVKTMTLPATYKMAPGAATSLTPEWTTDVDGVTIPTDQKLIWTSSDPSVVSVVDETTGELYAHKEGTATITATTAGENSVPAGQEQISSSCLVTVETPTVPINIGDYYYSDGTWSTERDNKKTVIGVVFAKVDATGSDLMLRDAYPTASHGLVVGLTEYTLTFGEHTAQDNQSNSSYMYFNNNGWPIPPKADDDQTVLGYTYTLALKGYREARGGGDWASLVTVLDNLSAVPNASMWYIPSFAEMNLMREVSGDINTKLKDAGGATLGTENYWTSTLQKYDDWRSYNDLYASPFSMQSGTWASKNVDKKASTCSMRVVLAF